MDATKHGLTRRRFALAGAAALSAPSWSAAAVRADVDILRDCYEALHPGLYRYNTPAQMAAHFALLADELAASGPGPERLKNDYLVFSRFAAKIRCGHTYANFFNQSAAVRHALFEGRNRLPFEFRWLDGRMVVTRDLTDAQHLPRGSAVLAVNGVPAAALLARLMPYARADGGNDAKRVALLELQGLEKIETLDVFLGLLMPELASTVSLDLALPDGTQKTVDAPLLSFEQRMAARRIAGGDQGGWSFDASDAKLAVLKMPDWALYNSKWDWRAWLAECFAQLARRPPPALVIDLRGNEGGLDVGHEILPYLVGEAVEIPAVPRLVRYRDTPPELDAYLDTWDNSFRHWGDEAEKVDDRFYALRPSTPGAQVIQPRAPRYRGQVFVLIGPENSSATFQFAQLVKQLQVARLVGRPTGGNLRGINGGAFFFVRLPATGLELDLPLIARFAPGHPPDTGVAPDIAAGLSVDDIIRGADPEMREVRSRL